MGRSAFSGPPRPESDVIGLVPLTPTSPSSKPPASAAPTPTISTVLGKALEGGLRREKMQLATRFGIRFALSLKRLVVGWIDLHSQHRIDTRVPAEEIGVVKKLYEKGKIKYIVLSEASASTIRRVRGVHSITAVQLECSLWSRDRDEDSILTCRELGIGIIAYGPLGRVFFSSGPKIVDNLSQDL